MRLSARLGRVNTNTIAVDYSVTVNPMVQLLIRSTNRVTCHGEGRQPQGILLVWEGEAARHRSLHIHVMALRLGSGWGGLGSGCSMPPIRGAFPSLIVSLCPSPPG